MILDYTCARYKGACSDAIGIRHYREWGDDDASVINPTGCPAGVAPPPNDWKGLPGIIIEREHGLLIRLVFREENERDNLYLKLLRQIQQQLK